MKAKRVLFRYVYLFCLTAAVSLLSLPFSLRAERISIATPSRGLFEFPVVVAMRKGFYKSEGLDVDKIQMQPAIGVKSLISGSEVYNGASKLVKVAGWASIDSARRPV